MRWIGAILAMAIVAGFIGSASGQQAGCAACNGTTPFAHASPWSMDGGACAPPGYTLVPGCCEYSQHCCDNAWAGYCEHRAKVQSFWARVGVPKPRCCRPFARSAAPANGCPESMTPCTRPMPEGTLMPTPATMQPTPAARSARVTPVFPQAAVEKKSAGESTVSVWEWRF